MPGGGEGVGTAGRDQGKGALGVALPQDLKRDGRDGFQAPVLQGALHKGKIASFSPASVESLCHDRTPGHE